MSIKVCRNTGFMGSAVSLKLKINGDRIEKINRQEVLTIQIPKEQVTFGIKLFFEKKKEILVKNGDVIEIVYKKYFSYFYWGIISSTILVIPLFDGFTRWGIAFSIIFLSLVIQYFCGTYDLVVNGNLKT